MRLLLTSLTLLSLTPASWSVLLVEVPRRVSGGLRLISCQASQSSSLLSVRLLCPQTGGLICYENCRPTARCLQVGACSLDACSLHDGAFVYAFDSADSAGWYECVQGLVSGSLLLLKEERIQETLSTLSPTVSPAVSSAVSSAVSGGDAPTASSPLAQQQQQQQQLDDADDSKRIRRRWRGFSDAHSLLLSVSTVAAFLLLCLVTWALVSCAKPKAAAAALSPPYSSVEFRYAVNPSPYQQPRYFTSADADVVQAEDVT